MTKQFKAFSIGCVITIMALFIHDAAARPQGNVAPKAVSITEPDKSFVPSELQAEKLKVAQKDAIIAQLLYNQAQDGVNRAQAALDAAASAVKKENSWPDTVQFNKNTLTFFDAPEVKK